MDVKMLGRKLRDKLSGIEGFCPSAVDYLHGTTMYEIRPPAVDNVVKEAWFCDEHTVEVVPDSEKFTEAIEPPDEIEVALGDEVVDVVTGFEGVATEMVTYINGCVHFTVLGEYNAKKGEAPSMFLPWQRLALKEESRFEFPWRKKKKAEVKRVASEENEAKRGGPMVSSGDWSASMSRARKSVLGGRS